jgi:hypothetical protein
MPEKTIAEDSTVPPRAALPVATLSCALQIVALTIREMAKFRFVDLY